jgi:hypothetical protein
VSLCSDFLEIEGWPELLRRRCSLFCHPVPHSAPFTCELSLYCLNHFTDKQPSPNFLFFCCCWFICWYDFLCEVPLGSYDPPPHWCGLRPSLHWFTCALCSHVLACVFCGLLLSTLVNPETDAGILGRLLVIWFIFFAVWLLPLLVVIGFVLLA